MTKTQLWVATSLTAICILAIAARLIWPSSVIVDEKTIYLLALGALPWLTLFFKKFKIPGVLEGEVGDRSQGTERPLPPSAPVQANLAPGAISQQATKILATLWRYQKQHFQEDFTKGRWTFAILSTIPEYANYLTGLTELVNKGWVTVSPQNNQCLLTNEGIAYVQQHRDIQESDNVYTF